MITVWNRSDDRLRCEEKIQRSCSRFSVSQGHTSGFLRAIPAEGAKNIASFCKFFRELVPNLNEHLYNMKKIEYTLFNQTISRRAYIWLWFLCPGLALAFMLNSRRVGAADQMSTPSLSTLTR